MPLPKAVANSITHAGLRAIVVMFVIWLLLMLISLYHDGRAHAHDAQHLSDWIGNQAYKSPNGEMCCGLGDCAMLDDNAVTPVPGGYAVHGSGTYFLPYGPQEVQRERFDETGAGRRDPGQPGQSLLAVWKLLRGFHRTEPAPMLLYQTVVLGGRARSSRSWLDASPGKAANVGEREAPHDRTRPPHPPLGRTPEHPSPAQPRADALAKPADRPARR